MSPDLPQPSAASLALRSLLRPTSLPQSAECLKARQLTFFQFLKEFSKLTSLLADLPITDEFGTNWDIW
jgi:hypothetical protein